MANTLALPFPQPASGDQYARDLLYAIGAPSTAPNLSVIEEWINAESATFPGYNALGTELYLPGATPDPSNPQVYDYPDATTGITAAVDMLEGRAPQTKALAPKLVSDLKSGGASQEQLITDIYNSGWAGSGKDSYDASTIAGRLGQAAPKGSGPSNASQSAGSNGGTQTAELTGFDWNPLSWINSLGNVSQQAGQDVGSWLNSEAGSAVKGAAGFTGGAIASGLSGAVSAITGTSGPTELGVRFAEIIAGGILFAIGLFALVYAASGRSASGDLGTAAKLAPLALA